MSINRTLLTVIGIILPLSFSLAFMGCLKSDRDISGSHSPTDGLKESSGLDALHGGARVVLPEIDPIALNKHGAIPLSKDTVAQAWFELTISGANMPEMFFEYPLGIKGGYAFEIKAIPAGKARRFHGRLLNRSRQLTHEGVTVADIRGGEYSDLRLYLARALGSVNVCVVIEGQKPPVCAVDTLPPPPPPPSDSQFVNRCWYVSSDSVTGQLRLYDFEQNGYRGVLTSLNGSKLPVTTWNYSGDSLYVLLISADMGKKWQLRGSVQLEGNLWVGAVFGLPAEAHFPFYGKPIPCETDTVIIPPQDTVTPPKDSVKAGLIPSLTSSEGEVTRCFEMRLDYGTACETSAFAKMSFFAGQITRGYLLVGSQFADTYLVGSGKYDEGNIHIQSVRQTTSASAPDSLMFDGAIAMTRNMAKGSYVRLPSMKKGIWNMTSMVCGNWTPKTLDPKCFVSK